MWADRKGWASRAPLSKLQLLGAAGTAEGWKHTARREVTSRATPWEKPILVYGFSWGALCTQHRWEWHASPWGKKHWPSKTLWPLGGSGQGQKPLKMATE